MLSQLSKEDLLACLESPNNTPKRPESIHEATLQLSQLGSLAADLGLAPTAPAGPTRAPNPLRSGSKLGPGSPASPAARLAMKPKLERFTSIIIKKKKNLMKSTETQSEKNYWSTTKIL